MSRDQRTERFDREAAVRQWRNALLSRGGLTTDDVDELQDHLGGIEEELLATSLERDEAFWLAAHRVGTPDALTREFNLVRPLTGWLLRLEWALIGIAALFLLVPLAHTVVLAIYTGLVRLLDLSPPAVEVLERASTPIVLLLIVTAARGLIRTPPSTVERWISRFTRYPLPATVVVLAVAFGSSELSGHLSEALGSYVPTPENVPPAWYGAATELLRYSSDVIPVLVAIGPMWLHRQRERRGLLAPLPD